MITTTAKEPSTNAPTVRSCGPLSGTTASPTKVNEDPHSRRSRTESGTEVAAQETRSRRGRARSRRPGRLRSRTCRRRIFQDLEVNRKKSLRSARLSWQHLADFFAGDRVKHITSDRWRAYQLKRRKEGSANGSINREGAALKRAFALLVRAGRLAAAPYLPMLKEASPRQGFLEPADFQRLCAALPAHLQDFATVLYGSGWRISELRSLEWRDVDLNAGEIHLRPENSKNDLPRRLPLDETMAAVIARAADNRRLDCSSFSIVTATQSAIFVRLGMAPAALPACAIPISGMSGFWPTTAGAARSATWCATRPRWW